MNQQTPRMTKACREGRGIEEGCFLELECARLAADLKTTNDMLKSEHDAHMECHRQVKDEPKVVEPHETIDMIKQRIRVSDLQVDLLRQINIKLVGAIDLIRESLNGGNAQDLLFIINNALDAAVEPQTDEEDEETDCPIHGKIGGLGGDCPRC